MMRRSLRSGNRIFTSGGSLPHGEEEALDETASPGDADPHRCHYRRERPRFSESERDRDPQPEFESYGSIELTGTMDEPIRDVRDVEITLYSATAEPVRVGKEPVPWIGLIHGFRPVVRPSVFIPQRAFDRLWVLAGAGMAKYAYMTLTKPHYQHAYVLYLSLSTHPEE
jgi:hypothetical protein